VATRPRTTERTTDDTLSPTAQVSTGSAEGTSRLDQEVRPEQSTEERLEGRRSATLDLPFVTAQFRVPDLPGRDDLNAAVHKARSVLPSTKALLFYGGLAVTVVVGAIEWPVAAAIGVGSALASRGEASPEPRGGQQTETTGSAESTPGPTQTRT
jgi:hypothetical protein